MSIRTLTVIVALLLLAAITTPAMAVYHTRMGRFLQRDPNGMQIGPTNPPRITPRTIGSEGGQTFIQRDTLEPQQQYSDGMNYYQYARSNPVNRFDPTGLNSGTKPNQQCTLNGQPVTMTFDGETFSGAGFSAPAVSGRPLKETRRWSSVPRGDGNHVTTYWWQSIFDYSKARQKINNVGPAIEGKYWIDVCCTNSSANAWRHSLFWKKWGWGDYSWHMRPYTTTNMAGNSGPRSGFFIHGGTSAGSAGCVDLLGRDVDFNSRVVEPAAKQITRGKCCYIDIVVSYAKQSVVFEWGHDTIVTPGGTTP